MQEMGRRCNEGRYRALLLTGYRRKYSTCRTVARIVWPSRSEEEYFEVEEKG
jgi:hypothetical protein